MLAAILLFIIFVLILAWFWHQGYVTVDLPQFKWIWLLVLALLPRLSLFFSTELGPQLIVAQGIIFVFLIVNRHIPGFYWLLLGLLSNFVATLANGGFMPVPVELVPQVYAGEWQIYDRIVWSVIIPADEIVFYPLSDHILIEAVGKSYSPGDFLTLIGAMWVLLGSTKLVKEQPPTSTLPSAPKE